MNTCTFALRVRSIQPGRVSALLACLLIAALLLPGGAGWTAQAAPPAQEAPPNRLPYDGPFDLPRQPGVVPQGDAGQPLLAPEYVEWSRLVFQSARNNNDWDIYAARGDGSNQVNISNHGSMDIHPRLNRGATRVVFASNRHSAYDLFTMNADGGGQARIVDSPGDDVFPAWSPDGGRIAFQAYRDGQAEIYVANADGSGQTRLTNHGDYDGQPAWSPDGAQIAFVRRESGGYRIWAMNADGSNQRSLSNQAYSADPAWSPDGSQIAYDADGNGDGWQEIWLMNADGSNQRQAYAPTSSQTDAWVGSWSPDGRYVAFTQISWTYYQGQWYWTYAYLYAWDSVDTWRTIQLSGNGADWNPRWESADAQAPTSSVHPLAAQSPGPFTVAWSGSDAGGSELKNFDIQVKNGAGGAWSNWKSATGDTSGSYSGVGGHTYFFRSRARDNADNVEPWPVSHDAVTAVEAFPPQTAVQALPAFSRSGPTVRWGGADPGGSGIQSYDVQVRKGAGAWTDWRMGVSETAAIFDGTAGVEVRFRARARDRAQNLEAWPPTADTSTTLYTWAIAGQASDNRGAPVIGMATTTTPAAFHGAPSDHDGAYAAHVAAEAASYSASWGKAGYGALPSTAFAPDLDASVDVVLPPADNVVQNWGFENGSSSWQLGGNLTAEVTDTAKHSGSFSALLGTHTQPLGYSTAVGTCKVDIGCESSVMDSSDTIHTAWLGEGDSNRRYKYKPLGEPWSTSTVLPGPWGTGMGKPVLTVDESMGVHALWVAGNQLYYSKKPPGMDWLYAEHVPTDLYVSDYVYRLAVNASGEVKVIWLGLHLRWEVYFSQRNANGSWTPKINITGPYTLQPERTDSAMRLAIDSAGLAHVLWLGSDGINPRNVFYAAETVSGSWLPAANISGCSTSVIDADMVIDSRGTAHVVWTCQGVNYRMRSPNATWLEARQIEPTANSAISLAVDRLDRLHLVWYLAQPWLQIRYVTFSNGIWSPPVAVAPPPSQPQDDVQPIVAVDDTLSVHVLWREGGTLLRYVVKRFNGQWSSPVDVYHVGGEARIQTWQLLADHTGTPHAIWMIAYGPFAVMYAGPETSATTGDAFMAQSVQIPSGASAPTLSFLYNFASTFPSNSRLEVTIDDSIAPTLVFSTTTSTGNWTHAWADLSPWAGHTVTLRFRVVEEAGGAQAGAYIDEVTVGSAHPDIWVSQPAWQAAAAGRTFETTLTYGNRGGVAASGGQVTLQLPAELSFVSAVPPPSATSPTLRWDVGALPAQSGPQTIRVTLQVAASATGGSTVSTTARVTSGTTELEQANNTAAGSVYLGSVRYMPVIMR